MTKYKGTVLAVLTGATMLSGGCLAGNWQKLLLDTAFNVATEWLLDNDNIIDLFEDGNVDTAE
jgi:hypothetical protein